MNKGLYNFVQFWNEVYTADNPIEDLKRKENLEGVPESSYKKFQIGFYPEPYYGYFSEDMSNDVLLLLLNPGLVSETKPEEIKRKNDRIKKRYAEPWNKQDYFEEEERLKSVEKWRSTRFNQSKNIVGEFDFLHTMEFFPFHSKNFPGELTKEWVYNLNSTNLSFHALKDIAISKKVKHILSVGKNWEVVFEKRNVPLNREVELIKHDGQNYSFKFKQYQFTQESLPIVSSILGSGAISLPSDEFAVKILRILLGLSNEQIPAEHPTYEIIIK